MQAQHKLLITGLIAASLALPLTAQARVYVDVNVAPPAPNVTLLALPFA